MITRYLEKSHHDMDEDKEKAIDTAVFVASTDSADRYGDIVDQRGWDLESYKRNPIVLLNHDNNSLPIGRGEVSIDDRGLIIKVTFDMNDPKAALIAEKVAGGFMSGVSVGFAPLKSIARAELPDGHFAYSKSGGRYFERAELLEVSVVTIPANAEAVIAAKEYSALKDYIIDIVKSEVKAMTRPPIHVKHILEVIEDENTVTVIYAKHENNAAEVMDEDNEPSEETEAGYSPSEDNTEDELNKNFIKALSDFMEV